MIWGIGFLIACANLRDHFRGERNRRRVYRWPPRLFREVVCLRPLWPVAFLLPAMLWPLWVIVFIVRENIAKDVVDADVDVDLEVEALRPSRRFPGGAWEREGRGRKGFESQRRPSGTSPESYISEPPPAYWP